MSTKASGLPSEADLLIVSVDAANRLAALKAVLEHCTPKAIILEKILFNKFEDFETVQTILDDLKVPCWVNCSRNVWPGYRSLKETLGDKAVKSYTVSGSDWGLGCNAIHFIAALEYLAGEPVIELAMDTDTAAIRDSKRAGYKEVTGTLHGKMASGGTISLSSLPEEGQAISVHIKAGDDHFVIAEGKTISINDGEDKPFPLLYTSQLTEPLIDILKHSHSNLPNYADSVHQHRVMFKALNDVFYGPGNSEVQCPVT